MKPTCPQCGIDNEQTAPTCFSCGYVFGNDSAEHKPRISKLAILAFILGSLCLVTFFIPLLPAIIIGVVATQHIRKSNGRLRGKRLAIAGVLIPLVSLPVFCALACSFWWKDAGPVPNEFTEADFVSVKPENQSSWEVLCRLNDQPDDPDGAPAIGLSREDIGLVEMMWEEMLELETTQSPFDFILTHSDDIQYLWKQSAKGRLIIEELSAYGEIADLTKPCIDIQVPHSADIKLLVRINSLHVLLLAQTNNDMQACDELITFDSVFRHHSAFARSLIAKLVCYNVFEKNIETAALMANDQKISGEALLLLQSHFAQLNQEQMSLKNGFIHEYLLFKNAMNDSFGAFVGTRLYKQNSICRYYDCFCRNWLLLDKGQTPYNYCPISVWPWEEPLLPKMSLDPDHVAEHFYDLYLFYNPIGSMQMKIMIPAASCVIDIKDKILIEDDLLQWIFARRLGQEGSLKARAYSEAYMVDLEKEIVFSVGPDGEPYTKDDIKMRINPQSLGLK